MEIFNWCSRNSFQIRSPFWLHVTDTSVIIIVHQPCTSDTSVIIIVHQPCNWNNRTCAAMCVTLVTKTMTMNISSRSFQRILKIYRPTIPYISGTETLMLLALLTFEVRWQRFSRFFWWGKAIVNRFFLKLYRTGTASLRPLSLHPPEKLLNIG